MNDQDIASRLAEAASAAPDQLGLSLDEVRRRGRGRRNTRIGLTAAAAVLAVTAGTTGAVALAGSAGPTVGPQAAASGSAAPQSTLPSTLPPAPSEAPSEEPLPNQRIDADDPFTGGKLTFWTVVQDSRFILVVGHRTPAGALEVDGTNSDPDSNGPGDPGFHAGWDTGELQAPGEPGRPGRLITGYVVGDVATVTLNVAGVAVTAKVAALPGYPAVHVWWHLVLASSRVPKGGAVTDLTARNAAGTVVAGSATGAIAAG